MNSILLSIGLSLGLSAADPPPMSVRPFPQLNVDYFRQDVKSARTRREVIESNLELFEALLRDHPGTFSPKSTAEMQNTIRSGRVFVEKIKKFEQELEQELTRWERQQKLNPGRETDFEAIERILKIHKKHWSDLPIAPMPREAKPRDADPKP